MRRPDLFIVGAPKCGTTALYTYLRRHPEVYMAPIKEPHFFGSDLPFADRRPVSEAEYLGYFRDARPHHRRVGEASVWYLYSTRAAAEIRAYSPDARIVIMLRNPVDMMYSLHSQRRFTGIEDIADFAAALRAEPDRRRGVGLPRRGMLHGGLYRAIASYPDQVARYLDAFGRDRVHVVLFDDLRADTAAAYAAVVAFLGLTAVADTELGVENPNRRPRFALAARTLADPPRVVVRVAHALLSRPTRVALVRRLRDLNSRVAARPPLAPALRRHLQEELRPEIDALGRLLGRDLSGWCA